MNTERLNQLVEASSLNKSQIAKRCGISRTTLDHVLSGADAKVSTIENLAGVLCVNVGFLFDDAPSSSADKINYLEQLLKEKERLITVLMADFGPRASLGNK